MRTRISTGLALLVGLSIAMELRGDEPASAAAPDTPIYQMSPAGLDRFIAQQQSIPDLPARVVAIARRNIGQPYELYLLGEAPFETIDDQPVFCIEKSDCVVFVEHTLAMALSRDLAEFLAMLQRIRYRDGEIGVRTRNHYTEADWNRNNAWLLREITDELAGSSAVKFTQKVNRAKFFSDRYKIEVEAPPETIEESFIPFDQIDPIRGQLRDGDIVNFVSGRGDNYWVGHVGLVAIGDDGQVNLIHSAAPQVREESIDAYIARATKDRATRLAEDKSTFAGFKFLRLRQQPLTELRRIDGDAAPRVILPTDSPVTWEQFVRSVREER